MVAVGGVLSGPVRKTAGRFHRAAHHLESDGYVAVPLRVTSQQRECFATAPRRQSQWVFAILASR